MVVDRSEQLKRSNKPRFLLVSARFFIRARVGVRAQARVRV